jgi:glucose-6-phosphate isomerase
MNMKSKAELWQRYQQYYSVYPQIDMSLDISRMSFPDDYFDSKKEAIATALKFMQKIEDGEEMNPDEKRMVGHYWLRNPDLAPKEKKDGIRIPQIITKALADIKQFAADVHAGHVHGSHGPFMNVLIIGIGGSALGPQFVAKALGHPIHDKMRLFFFDNTDPDGMDRVLWQLVNELGQTLCVVISKSGGTKETRNGMLEAQTAYQKAGLSFEQHAVAITMEGSDLDKLADNHGWIHRFPMWDWVGGRTSQLSAVGLLPAALQGLDIDDLLAGAKDCDIITRRTNVKENPALQLALMWYFATEGKGTKDMVIIPYKDRLELFSKYLQQLIMESLGKELDLDGKKVNQGVSVYGNKGSTDQHAYIQQLRDGVPNFFATFIEVLRDREGISMAVEPGGITSGDYLNGFLQGTRQALFENGRDSITITIGRMNERAVGVLIALYERTVGMYAAGKLAADAVIVLRLKVMNFLISNKGKEFTLEQIAQALGAGVDIESVFKICEHLSANPDRCVSKIAAAGNASPFAVSYKMAK